MSKNRAVFGIYASREAVEDAVDRLRAADFRQADISVLFPSNEGSKDFAHERGTKAPEGVAAGASSGALIGGALGWLTGIGTLAIPGLGPFIAAGPIMAALAGVGAGGALGGLVGGLIGVGIPEYEAKRYAGRIRKGGILLSVHCDNSNWEDLAREILAQTGAQDISSAAEEKADFDTSDRPRPRRTARLDSEIAPGVAAASPPLPARRSRAKGTLVREVMSTSVELVDANVLLRDAAQRLSNSRGPVLLVVEDERVIGLLSDRDVTVRAIAAGHDPNATPVRVAMSSDFEYLNADQNAAEALATMREKQAIAFPVIDAGNRIVGVASVADLAGVEEVSPHTVQRAAL